MKQTARCILLQTTGIHIEFGKNTKILRFIQKMIETQRVYVGPDRVTYLTKLHQIHDNIVFRFGLLEWTWTEEKGWIES